MPSLWIRIVDMQMRDEIDGNGKAESDNKKIGGDGES